MQEIVIHSFEELQKEVFRDVWDEKLKRYRNSMVYRGVADSKWGLLPSLNRLCFHDLSLEKHIIRSFKKYGYADLSHDMSFWQVLAMGQQFGLPTRLLDWTYSPLVAAHFATEDTDFYDRDGAIICCNTSKMNRNLPESIRAILEDEGGNVFTIDMLDGFARDFAELKAGAERPYSLFFEPASMVNRIANQYALFSLSSCPEITIDKIEGNSESFLRLIIPKDIKLEIRDKLDYINISERMIYPGLDGICKWIARRYAPLSLQKSSDNLSDLKE